MNEIKAMFNAILENQKITNAKLEALTMDVRHLQGDVELLKEDVAVLKEDVVVLKQDVAEMKVQLNEVAQSAKYLVHKTGEHEKEIFVLKLQQNG